MGIKAFSSAAFAFLSLAYPLHAEACEPLLVTTEAMAFQRTSEKRDSSRTKHLAEERRPKFELGADRDGKVIYKLSGEKITTSTTETLISVWTIDNDGPGRIYGVHDDIERQGDEYKHSSFNYNKPVLGAWMMTVDDGKITEVVDGSGHYKPTPLNMYYAAKQLEARGFDLHEAQLVFEYGLEDIGGLRISAEQYISVLDGLPREKRESLDEVTFYRKNLKEFLDLLQRHTEDQKTIALIDLFRVRNAGAISEKIEDSIVRLASYLNRNPHDLDFICARLFKNKSMPHFAYRPVYFDLTIKQTSAIQKRHREILLDNAKGSLKSAIESWLRANT